MPQGEETSIVLFDGACDFCSGAVRFILSRDRKRRFRFAPLESVQAAHLLRRFDLPADRLDTVVLIEGGRCYVKSSAVLRIARGLSGPWSLLGVFFAVPKKLRDFLYDGFAARRRRWFGRRGSCFVPTEDVRERFLE